MKKPPWSPKKDEVVTVIPEEMADEFHQWEESKDKGEQSASK